MKTFAQRFLCVILPTLLMACSSNLPNPEATAPAPVPDAAANEIAEASASVTQSLNTLAAVEKANMAPQAAKLYPQVAQMDMPGVSSIDWNGPIEPLLRQVAKAAGYRLRIIGPAPLPPVTVTIHADQEANADIVRDAALQANNRAIVRTIPTSKIVELRYLGK